MSSKNSQQEDEILCPVSFCNKYVSKRDKFHLQNFNIKEG